MNTKNISDAVREIHNLSSDARKVLEMAGVDISRLGQRDYQYVPPMGARRGALHPSRIDLAVLDLLTQTEGTLSVSAIESSIVEAGFSVERKHIVQAVKWLLAVGKLVSEGRGRAMTYRYSGDTTELQMPTEAEQRVAEAPTVRAAILAVFNSVASGDRLKAKDIATHAMAMFPGVFNKSAFGGTISKLAKDGVISFEGTARNRSYFRTETLEGAADFISESDTSSSFEGDFSDSEDEAIGQ